MFKSHETGIGKRGRIMDHNSHKLTLVNTAELIIRQLEAESKFLDGVIQSSLQMQNLLRIERRRERGPESESPATVAAQISDLKQQLSERFQPVKAGRDAMLNHVQSLQLQTSQQNPLTARELAGKVAEPHRSRLTQLRADIRSKLNRIQAISMGNQAVLVYTMDFYNRLLTGLNLRPAESAGYDATGSSTTGAAPHLPGNFIQTTC